MNSGCSLPICAMVNSWISLTHNLHKQENIMAKMRIPNNAGMITIVYQYVDHILLIRHMYVYIYNMYNICISYLDCI